MPRLVRWLLIVSMLLVLLAACEPSSAPEPTATPIVSGATITPAPTRAPAVDPTPYFGRDIQPSRNTATLRVIHAASQIAALDVQLNDLSLAGSLGFGLASGLTTVIPDTYTLSARERGSDTVLSETSLTLVAGMMTDVVVVQTAEGVKMLVLDGPERPLEAGSSVIRAVNALADAGAVSVELNLDEIAAALAPGEASSLLRYPEGDIDAVFSAGGNELMSNRLRLRALSNMLLVVTGVAGRPQLLVLESPTLSLYSLRVVNMSAEAREVDIYFDDALVASNLGYQAATERVSYSTASASLSVYAASADLSISNPYLTGQRVIPAPGTTVTLAIYGPVADLQAMWIEEDVSPVPAGQSRYTFAHIMTGSAALRVGVNSTDLADIRPFAYGETSQPVLFDTGTVRLFVRDSGRDGSVVEVREALTVAAGQSVIYFITGANDEDEAPLTVSETVAVDENLSVQPIETPQGVFQVRYVNSIVSQPVIDINQDGARVVSGLRYGVASPLTRLNSTSFQVVAQMGSSTLIDLRFTLPAEGEYTVFIYGTPENGIVATAIPDGRVTVGTSIGSVRLINLTQDPFATFGIGTISLEPVTAERTLVPTLVPTATAEGGSALDIGLPRLPVGVAIPISDVGSGKASRVVGAQANSLVYIINDDREIIDTLPQLAFAPGTHTDIVVYEYRTPTTTDAIVFPIIYVSR